MKLDRHYNIKTEISDPYSDAFDGIVDLLVKAKEEGKITNEQFVLLLNLAIKKEYQKDVRGIFHSLFDTNDTSQKHTLFIQLKSNHTQYA